jgi:hypothetical protein
VNAFGGKEEFVSAMQEIGKRVTDYQEYMGSLTATMVGEGLKHDKRERRRELLAWIWKEDEWKMHAALTEKRLPTIGTWIFECPEFKDWLAGHCSRIFICYGMGRQLLRHIWLTLHSWNGNILHFVRFY